MVGDRYREKMKTLLEDISIPIVTQEKYFSAAEFQKVVVEPAKKCWQFIFQLPELLESDVCTEFLNKLEAKYSQYAVIDYKFNIINQATTNGLVVAYWPFVLKKLQKLYPQALSLLTNDSLTVEDNNCVILMASITDTKFIEKKYLIYFQKYYEKLGFKNLVFSVRTDEVLFKQMVQKFEQEKEAEDKLLSKQMLESQIKQEKEAPTLSADQPEFKLGKEPLEKDVVQISHITGEDGQVVIEGTVFFAEVRELNTGANLLLLKVTDGKDSILVKMYDKDAKHAKVCKLIKEGQRLRIKGQAKLDTFNQFNPELVIMLKAFCLLPALEIRRDLAPAGAKRVELHLHTKMSQMDAIVGIEEYVKRAKHYGHSAIALTDHASLQSFPDAYAAAKKYGLKMIYGLEAYLVDDAVQIVVNSQDKLLEDCEYVVFDVETTGLSAVYNTIIEVGAVKIKNGTIVDEFSAFANPHHPLSALTVQLTGITDDMVNKAPKLAEVLGEFAKWSEGAIMVAHNASFDMGFLEAAYQRAGMVVPTFTSIDTLELARCLYPTFKRFSLNILAKKLGVTLVQHHRAIYDAQATGHVFLVMVNELKQRKCTNMLEINNLIDSEKSFVNGRPKHCTLLVKNKIGLKNLFKLVSLAHTKYFHRVPRLPRSVLMKYREGLLVGSGCDKGEVFETLLQKPLAEAKEVANFYDYLEIHPKDIYKPLLEGGNIKNNSQLEQLMQKLIAIGEELGKLVVATGNAHILDKEDNIYRQILINAQAANPLNRHTLPHMHFRTTTEMLNDFAFLGAELAHEVVVTNSNKIADMIEEVSPIKDKLYVPTIDGAEEEVRQIAYDNARKLYGVTLPKMVEQRIEKELTSIIGHGFAVIYLISRKLVKKSLDDGYLVGSRGSVGSSLVATLLEITEVNPLPPHYICPKCQDTVFFDDGSVSSGYDLPTKKCPKCNINYKKEGQDIPFETFLGFNGDKVPDIDLNFSGDYQAVAHQYTKELFGEDYVFRAGTISTVAEKTAYGFVRGYLEDKSLTRKNVEIERLAKGITGVKRTTGQHPGGIIVIPNNKDVYDFTPIQYPADNMDSSWKTTHFDFHSIHDNVLKLDILGHDDPTVIRKLQDLSGIDPQTIPLDDPKVMQIFSSPTSLGVSSEQIMCNVGTLGVPEFGTYFVRQMLEATKPTKFSELVQISGLSHGTDVWLKNAQVLIEKNICTLKDVIGCRDDIMVYLIYRGLDSVLAFQIMESVRKGKGLTPEMEAAMKQKDIPQWYIESCQKIKYMFPKAHAAAYVLMAVRIAYFKVHHPLYFYATYFSVRAGDFDIETMVKGTLTIKAKLREIAEKGHKALAKEKNLQTVLELAYEMCQRGFTFQKVDINRSLADEFVIEGNSLIPPFITVPGLGGQVAEQIVTARQEKAFLSREDLSKRGKVSSTVISFLNDHGCLEELPEKNQLSFF